MVKKIIGLFFLASITIISGCDSSGESSKQPLQNAGENSKAREYINSFSYYGDYTSFSYSLNDCILNITGDRSSEIGYIYWEKIKLSNLNYTRTDFEYGQADNGKKYFKLVSYCTKKTECGVTKAKYSDGDVQMLKGDTKVTVAGGGTPDMAMKSFLSALKDEIQLCGGSASAY